MKIHPLLSVFAIATICLSCGVVSHAKESTTGMEVFSEVPGADSIVAGNYLRAIELMQIARSVNKLALSNNFCVAYTLSHQFHQARVHCDRAVEETLRRENYGTTWLEQTRSHRVKRAYKGRAREHLRVLESLEHSMSRKEVIDHKHR